MPDNTVPRAGHAAFMYLSTSTGGAVSKLAYLVNYNLVGTRPPILTTNHDSSGETERIAGIGDYTGSAEFRYAMGQATHKTVYDVLRGETKVDFEFYPTGSSSDGSFSGAGFVTNFDIGTPLEDALGANINFEISGGLTRSSSSS